MKNKLTKAEHVQVIIQTGIFTFWMLSILMVAISFDLLKYFE